MNVTKKVGIVTICDTNYGNRLQNFALQQVILQLGNEVETLYFHDMSKAYYLRHTVSPLRRTLKAFVPVCLIRRKHFRERNFWENACGQFTQKYILSKTIEIKRPRDIKRRINPDNYDCFIVGSDQVWNPKFAGDDYFFLTFARDNQKNAYAASIGYELIPEKFEKIWYRFWRSFRNITVREEAAANIVFKATHSMPEVVLDPTFLLEKKEWDDMADGGALPKELADITVRKYTLLFFIGEMPKEAAEYKRKNRTHVVDISDRSNAVCQNIGPAEFVRLIKDSETIWTDSYHCLVFAVIFCKNYRVFKRITPGVKNMTSRMEQLFKLTGLGYVMETGEYEEAQKRLAIKRKESIEILKHIINGQE